MIVSWAREEGCLRLELISKTQLRVNPLLTQPAPVVAAAPFAYTLRAHLEVLTSSSASQVCHKMVEANVSVRESRRAQRAFRSEPWLSQARLRQPLETASESAFASWNTKGVSP